MYRADAGYLMYEEINRFIGPPDQAANFDSSLGTSSGDTARGVARRRLETASA
jgi:hypothetical protein